MSRIRLVSSSVIAGALAVMLCAPTSASAEQRGRSRGSAPRGHAVTRSAPQRVIVAPRVVHVSPYRFARPYYTFRPRVSLGFGLFVGYPVRYPYYYGYPYAYPYPYPAYAYPPAPYGYPPPGAYPPPAAGYPSNGYPSNTYPSNGYPSNTYPSNGYPSNGYPPNGYPSNGYPSNGYPSAGAPPAGSVNVQPGANQGGVSFQITPDDAEVYVDGANVGRVSDFGPMSQPLSMAPGRHRIELRRSGYQDLVIDADIRLGEVIPYEGAMQPR
jgi:PEGA domain-containing protein